TVSLAAAPAVTGRHAGARPGEAFTFKFSVGPVESGRARMSVGMPGAHQGRRVIPAHAEAETSPWLSVVARIKDDYQLVFDPRTLLPVTVLSIEHGMRERTVSTRVDARNVVIEVTNPKMKSQSHLLMPEPVRDPMSALFALRAAPLRDGDLVTLDVI